MVADNTNDIIIYQTPDGTTSLDVRLDHETVWLTQKQMAELFDKDSDIYRLTYPQCLQRGKVATGWNYRGFLGSSKRGNP